MGGSGGVRGDACAPDCAGSRGRRHAEQRAERHAERHAAPLRDGLAREAVSGATYKVWRSSHRAGAEWHPTAGRRERSRLSGRPMQANARHLTNVHLVSARRGMAPLARAASCRMGPRRASSSTKRGSSMDGRGQPRSARPWSSRVRGARVGQERGRGGRRGVRRAGVSRAAPRGRRGRRGWGGAGRPRVGRESAASGPGVDPPCGDPVYCTL